MTPKTPTLRDAAQALLNRLDDSPIGISENEPYIEALRAA